MDNNPASSGSMLILFHVQKLKMFLKKYSEKTIFETNSFHLLKNK